MAADETVTSLRGRADAQEALIKDARAQLDCVRGEVAERDLARATAEADLSHLAFTCEDAANATIQDVVAEVEQLEREGRATPDAEAIGAEDGEDEAGEDAAVKTESERTLSAEEANAAVADSELGARRSDR